MTHRAASGGTQLRMAAACGLLDAVKTVPVCVGPVLVKKDHVIMVGAHCTSKLRPVRTELRKLPAVEPLSTPSTRQERTQP